MSAQQRTRQKSVTVGGHAVAPGSREVIDLPVADLYTNTSLHMPVQVLNGRTSGPTLFVSAAIHGDELNGVEIIRRLLTQKALKQLRGCLIAVPVVNVHGFLNQSRYLPDRRDLNRSFPGSKSGSVAARLAHTFSREIIEQCDYGIDLHTGAIHRSNLPQIRANLDDERTRELAKAFTVPVIINAAVRDGSLRGHASELNVPTLLYEGGEALRFDEFAIRAGTRGVLNIMRALDMLPARKSARSYPEPLVATSTSWIRAPASGVVRARAKNGQRVKRGETLAVISDPFGYEETVVESNCNGIIIGQSNIPLAHEGDALVHIARFDSVSLAEDVVEEFTTTIANGISRDQERNTS